MKTLTAHLPVAIPHELGIAEKTAKDRARVAKLQRVGALLWWQFRDSATDIVELAKTAMKVGYPTVFLPAPHPISSQEALGRALGRATAGWHPAGSRWQADILRTAARRNRAPKILQKWCPGCAPAPLLAVVLKYEPRRAPISRPWHAHLWVGLRRDEASLFLPLHDRLQILMALELTPRDTKYVELTANAMKLAAQPQSLAAEVADALDHLAGLLTPDADDELNAIDGFQGKAADLLRAVLAGLKRLQASKVELCEWRRKEAWSIKSEALEGLVDPMRWVNSKRPAGLQTQAKAAIFRWVESTLQWVIRDLWMAQRIYRMLDEELFYATSPEIGDGVMAALEEVGADKLRPGLYAVPGEPGIARADATTNCVARVGNSLAGMFDLYDGPPRGPRAAGLVRFVVEDPIRTYRDSVDDVRIRATGVRALRTLWLEAADLERRLRLNEPLLGSDSVTDLEAVLGEARQTLEGKATAKAKLLNKRVLVAPQPTERQIEKLKTALKTVRSQAEKLRRKLKNSRSDEVEALLTSLVEAGDGVKKSQNTARWLGLDLLLKRLRKLVATTAHVAQDTSRYSAAQARARGVVLCRALRSAVEYIEARLEARLGESEEATLTRAGKMSEQR